MSSRLGARLRTGSHGPQLAGAEVGEHVAAAQRGHPGAAVDEAAGDGAPLVVGVLRDRAHRRAALHGPAAVEGRAALEGIPPEVDPARASAQTEVDLLDVVLADVPDPDVAAGAVEREAPGVAQAVGVDLGRPAAAGEGVVRRDAVLLARRARVDVDAQDLAEQGVAVLRVVVGVAGAAAVARADVEEPVRPERPCARRCGSPCGRPSRGARGRWRGSRGRWRRAGTRRPAADRRTSSCSRRRTGRCGRSPGGRPGPAGPARRPDLTSPETSRNGVPTSLPRWRTRMVPLCCTM